MQKRAEKKISRHVKNAAFSEIFILILATVAVAFILGEANFVSAGVPINAPDGAQAGGGEQAAARQAFNAAAEEGTLTEAQQTAYRDALVKAGAEVQADGTLTYNSAQAAEAQNVVLS